MCVTASRYPHVTSSRAMGACSSKPAAAKNVTLVVDELIPPGKAHESEGLDDECEFYFIKASYIRGTTSALPTLHCLLEEAPEAVAKRRISRRAAIRGEYTDKYVCVSHRWEKKTAPDVKGAQAAAIRTYLSEHETIEEVWYDYSCMFQGKRTREEQAEFDAMLPEINLLYACSGSSTAAPPSPLHQPTLFTENRALCLCVRSLLACCCCCRYLSMRVLVLMDLSTLSRFWTQLEAWMAMQEMTPDGLRPARSWNRRWSVMCLHNAPPSHAQTLVEMWRDKTPDE